MGTIFRTIGREWGRPLKTTHVIDRESQWLGLIQLNGQRFDAGNVVKNLPCHSQVVGGGDNVLSQKIWIRADCDFRWIDIFVFNKSFQYLIADLASKLQPIGIREFKVDATENATLPRFVRRFVEVAERTADSRKTNRF